MVYTVTFNPSLDYVIEVSNFRIGKVNRTSAQEIFPGGKGINVSIVLSALGIKNEALGFVAGFTGKEIAGSLASMGINTNFVECKDGLSRINIKLRESEETEINGAGPTIDQAGLDKFLQILDKVSKDDILVLAGSTPPGLPDSIYMDIMERISGTGAKVVVDATGELLMKVLRYQPFLIKPNHHELGELYKVEITTKALALEYAKKLKDAGARNVLVSMAGDGAVFVGEDGTVIDEEAPAGEVVNSVGAGDSMVAGFIYGYLTYSSYAEAMRYAISAGSASAFSKKLATKEEIEALARQ